MTATVKIKNGTIKLPKELQKIWQDAPISVYTYPGRIILAGPSLSPRPKQEVLKAWKRMAGIWKGKKIPDAVKWQRKIRKEWERPIISPS